MATPVDRIVGGAQQIGQFKEQQQLRPFRRRQAERADVTGEAQQNRFIDEMRRTNMAEAAAEFLSLPPEQRQPFLQRRAAEIEARGGNPEDTLGMLQLPPDQQEQAAQATVQLGERLGLIGQQRKGTSTAAIQEFQLAKQQGFPGSFQDFLTQVKRAPQTRLTDVGGAPSVVDLATAEVTPLTTPEAQRTAAAQETAATTTAKKEAEAAVNREQQAPQRFEKTRSVVAQIDNTIGTINEAIGLVGPGTAGFAALFDFIPQSGPRELANAVTTIQANLGFQQLQAMRDASPTGGALGQVSERELNFLQSTLANLDTKQKPETLKKNLRKALRHYQNWRNAVINARGRDLMRDGLSEDQAFQQIQTEFPEG